MDYCAYGSLEVKGISGQKITAKGTSVSAAIVSSLLAWVKSQNPQKSRDEILGILDSLGEDLGEKGEDIYYGRGFLTFDFLKAGETEGEEPEKLTRFACPTPHDPRKDFANRSPFFSI